MKGNYRPQRVFSPPGCYPFLVWSTKKLINKVGSSGKRYWYRCRHTYPWEFDKLGFMSDSNSEQAAIKNELEERVCSITINREKFADFLKQWGEITGAGDPYYKKSLEYFLTLELIDFKKSDVYIDIGSWLSPFPELVRDRVKKIYCQDLSYRPGFYKDQIGCNAAHIPLPDESIDKMTLHCTFEHFEGNNDTRFIREAMRLLRPGGKCFIVPLYLSTNFINLTDPSIFSLERFTFDKGAMICQRFGFLNRFGRIYSKKELAARVISPLQRVGKATIYWIEQAHWLPITSRLRFALMLEKT